MTDNIIYKIITEAEWQGFLTAKRFVGSAVDVLDGYIHFSTAAQVGDTAAKHFGGKTGLILFSVAVDRLAEEAVRWEPSRGGALFPHLYGVLLFDAVVQNWPLPLSTGGKHIFPVGYREASL